MHFQAYLLEGIVRWNAARTIAAIDSNGRNLRSFNQKLSKKLQNLQLEVFQKPKDLAFQQAAAYTDELFGMKNIYTEIGLTEILGINLDTEIEEGLEDEDALITGAPDEDILDPELYAARQLLHFG